MSDKEAKLDLEKVPGENVRRLRGEKPWTQEQLAEEAGLRLSQVQRIEAGKHSPGCEIVLKFGRRSRSGAW